VEGHRRDFANVGVFGSELLPPTTSIDSVTAISVGFTTDADALADLLPHHYRPIEKPVVRVSYMQYSGIDYLAGRGYNVVSVNVPVVLSSDPTVSGPFNIVVWESLSHAVTLGRELQGYAKVYAEIPDRIATTRGFRFECSEFGTTLVTGEAGDGVQFGPEALARLDALSSDAYSLGWKYIPGVGAHPDCDYPTRMRNPIKYDAAWAATGTVTFCDITWDQAPISSRIVQRLRSLPNQGSTRAFIGTGSACAPRSTVERLDVRDDTR
jgi:acetoacetate decarboxylase